MEKNTILAVVLSTLVLIIFFVMQGLFAPPPPPPQPATVQPQQELPSQQQPSVTTSPDFGEQAQQILTEPEQESHFPSLTEEDASGPQELEYVTIETELLRVTLTNKGGNVISYELKDHKDKDENVNLIFAGANEPQAFSVAFGGLGTQPDNRLYHVNRISNNIIEFYRDFTDNEGSFVITKRYEFKPNEYMFKLTITLDGGSYRQRFNFSGNAYTLSFGPQIGPRFEKLDQRYDFRHYLAYVNGKRRNVKPNDIIDTNPAWAAIAGKYFAFVAIPNLVQYNIVFTETAEPGLPAASRFNLVRSAVDTSRLVDTYHFYLGPKNQETLAVYHTGRNDFGFNSHSITEIASSRGILAPLERLLKWMLNILVKIVPGNNFGIAIIILTLIVKIVFFPLTKKGSEATLRMQALAPKIKEIQEKYKGNPQKLQAEMGNFYKQEGYNPLSGCLPMLLQIPIFIAMYNLFNNHFDLRGAVFIPGWIPDLSVPEVIFRFPDNFRLPLLGWTALRGLPFIYVGSQLMYGKVTQTPGQQTNNQMKMMLYVMPIVFFFILYDVPSGLLLYWIFSNLLTLVQQLIINKYIKAKKAHAPVETQPVIAQTEKKKVITPQGKKKKKK